MSDPLVKDMLQTQLALAQPELVPLDQIYMDAEWNSRGEFSTGSIVELADSIRKNGLRDAILIRETSKYPGYKYVIVYGHRRYEAHRFLKRDVIPAKITTLDETSALVLNIVENLERVDVNFYQQATGVWRLKDMGLTPDMIKGRLNQSMAWVNRRLNLRELPTQCHRMAALGIFKPAHVDRINRIPNLAGKMMFLRKLGDTARRIETGQALVDSIDNIEAKSKGRKEEPRNTRELTEMQKRVQATFGIQDNEAIAFAWAGGYLSDDEYYTHLEARAKAESKFFRRPELITMSAVG